MVVRREVNLLLCVLLMGLLVIVAGCDENVSEDPVTVDPVIATPEVIEPDEQTPDPEISPPAEEPSVEIPTATTDGSLAFPKALAEVPAFAELMDRLALHLSIEPSIAADGDYDYTLDEDQRNALLAFLEENFRRIKKKASDDHTYFSYSGDYVELFLTESPDNSPSVEPLEIPGVAEAYVHSLLYQMVRGVAYGDLFFIVNLEDRQGNVIDSRYYVPSEMYH